MSKSFSLAETLGKQKTRKGQIYVLYVFSSKMLSIITIVLEDTVFDSTRPHYALIHLEVVRKAIFLLFPPCSFDNYMCVKKCSAV